MLNWSGRIVGNILYRKCSLANQALHTKSSRLWMSQDDFHKELSRIALYDYISMFN